MRVLRGRWWVGLITALALSVVPSVASAGIIEFGVWYGFRWIGTVADDGPLATSGFPVPGLTDPGDSPWTFVAPAAGAVFTVTDLQWDIDSFEVWDNGALVGATPLAGSATTFTCGIDPEVCIAANFSHGSFVFGAGAHSIELFNVDPEGRSGDGAFRLDPVPEPATLLLVGSGLVGLTLRRRRG